MVWTPRQNRVGRITQPQTPVGIDWGNPITWGLVSVLNAPTLSTKTYPSAIPLGVTNAGVAVVANGSFLAYEKVPDLGSAATLFMLGNMPANATSASIQCAIGTNSGGTQLFALQGAQNNGGLTEARAVIRAVNGGGITTAESASLYGNLGSNAIEPWCGVYDGTSALKIYRNGRDDTQSNLGTAVSGPLTAINTPTILGANRGTPSYALTGAKVALVLAWNRALTPAEIKSVSDNPWQVFQPANRAIFVPVSVGGSNQFVSPTTYTNSSSLFAPTVSVGAVSIAPALLTNSSSFFAPTVSLASGPQTVAPALFTNAQTFFAPTVTTGTVTVSAGLFSNASVVYSPTVTTTYTVTPSLLTNAQAFYAVGVTVGGVTVYPELFSNASLFWVPTVTGGDVTIPETAGAITRGRAKAISARSKNIGAARPARIATTRR